MPARRGCGLAVRVAVEDLEHAVAEYVAPKVNPSAPVAYVAAAPADSQPRRVAPGRNRSTVPDVRPMGSPMKGSMIAGLMTARLMFCIEVT